MSLILKILTFLLILTMVVVILPFLFHVFAPLTFWNKKIDSFEEQTLQSWHNLFGFTTSNIIYLTIDSM